MNGERKLLAALTKEERLALEQKLCDRQSGKCFICDKQIDLVLHHGQLEIDHIIPIADKGHCCPGKIHTRGFNHLI